MADDVEPRIGRRVRVRGEVQGVGFRYACQRQAEVHGVGGWVRNRSDGSVEALFVGPKRAVHDMVDWCRTGPRSAVVDDLDVEEVADTEVARFGDRFSIT